MLFIIASFHADITTYFYLGHVTDASVLQQINNQAHYSDASGFISPLSLAIVGRGSCDHRRRNGS